MNNSDNNHADILKMNYSLNFERVLMFWAWQFDKNHAILNFEFFWVE